MKVGRPKKSKRGPKKALPALEPVQEPAEEDPPVDLVEEEAEGPFSGSVNGNFRINFPEYEPDPELETMCPCSMVKIGKIIPGKDRGINTEIVATSKFYPNSIIK